ncbi:hypothetical protein GCM10027275_24940 [Rhabdobacter roseus]|uniref:Uncharacterized protein n=1 Tax=Rhabdobacter roseus TaxID=1655419 RepID=A0A840TM05_9BACT|nr:hypothetical protein [Rhabdobacter roseus]MBB5284434.1 hypothetical protein [Rhabdobacter roseus]
MILAKRDRDLDVLVKAANENALDSLEPRLKEKMERIEHISQLYFSKDFKFESEAELARRVAKKYGITAMMARKEVDLCKQLYVYANPIDWRFERALLLHSIKENINTCRAIGDEKTVQREHKNLISMLPEDPGDNGVSMVNINVINYNPTLVGAVEIPDLDKKIESMIAKDKREQEKLFEDQFDAWEDVKDE